MTPVRLYIKRHKLTGLKYFGKTTRSDVIKYLGSGKFWKRHIKKHGKQYVEHLWTSEYFTDIDELHDFALSFSELFDIKTSNEWANLQDENGFDGAPKGVYREGVFGEKNGMFGKSGELNPFFSKTHSIEQKEAWSEMRLGIKNPNYGGKAFTEETLNKLRSPKPNKENYKGTPGKITCIDRNGKAVQISNQIYNHQKNISKDPQDWEFVTTRSKEAKRRKNND